MGTQYGFCGRECGHHDCLPRVCRPGCIVRYTRLGVRARRLRRRCLFDGIARELACDYRVIAYDRRGCGESGDAVDGRYDLAVQAADLQAVIEHIGAPANVLAHSAGTLVTLELLRANPAIISRAILHEPAVTDEGAGLGAAPVLLEMIAAGKVSRALRAFLGAIGDSGP